MHILLVSATRLEITPFLKELKPDIGNKEFSSCAFKGHTLDILITGVGAPQTAYYLGKYLSNKYDLAINAGVCGSFDRNLKLGTVIQVREDYFADLGAEDNDKFLSISELNLPGAYYVKNEDPYVVQNIPQVRGVTVNTTHGNEDTIRKFTSRIKADIESMEGAAFLWACNKEKVKCLQLRSISNYVEKRDKSRWKMEEAVLALGKTLVSIL